VLPFRPARLIPCREVAARPYRPDRASSTQLLEGSCPRRSRESRC
jgi:hypothetical protein